MSSKADESWYHTEHVKMTVKQPAKLEVQRPLVKTNEIFQAKEEFTKVSSIQNNKSFRAENSKTNCKISLEPKLAEPKLLKKHPGLRPMFLRPYHRSTPLSDTLNGRWGSILRQQQLKAKRMMYNIYGLQVTITIGENATLKSIERISSCITSHTGIMGITSIPVAKGEFVCISTQTQAALIQVKNYKHPPRSLVSFLNETGRIWITEDKWESPLRKEKKKRKHRGDEEFVPKGGKKSNSY